MCINIHKVYRFMEIMTQQGNCRAMAMVFVPINNTIYNSLWKQIHVFLFTYFVLCLRFLEKTNLLHHI